MEQVPERLSQLQIDYLLSRVPDCRAAKATDNNKGAVRQTCAFNASSYVP